MGMEGKNPFQPGLTRGAALSEFVRRFCKKKNDL